jgi:hypothetical protein
MNDDVNLLVTIYYGDGYNHKLITCAMKCKTGLNPGELPPDCLEDPMEPLNSQAIHSLLPEHVRSCGPIVAVKQIFEVCIRGFYK